ncbi:MAG: M14 family zinc carboxypeptidase [Holophaga sp.]
MRILPALFAVAPLFAQAIAQPLLPGKSYRAEVPRPVVGKAHTPYAPYLAYVQALAASAKDRVRLSTLGVTEEGRTQPFLIISSPANLARLNELQKANAKLADPRICSEAEAQSLIQKQPTFVWLGYSIHGSEPAGSEAALAVAYHFAACQDPAVLEQLERTMILMDLTQNPDGRERHIQAVAEALFGENPPDPQDAQNQARWPSGRFNHRLFDLNRDWAWQTQTETRAKAKFFLQWNPQVLVDHHEMYAENTYFFPPNMAPVHAAFDKPFGGPWQATFGQAMAKAFDQNAYTYFTRDVFDLFYPSYGDSWSSFMGAVGMTYEVGSGGGLTYRRRDGALVTLESRVQRHVLGSLTTVATAAENRAALLQDWYRSRRERIAKGDRAGAYVLAEGNDPGRARALAELLRRNGVEVLRTAESVSTSGFMPIATGPLPPMAPAGSYLVSLAQPHGALASALLEKEAKVAQKPSYDTTAWSLPLLFNVPCWFAPIQPKVSTTVDDLSGKKAVLPEARYAYALPAGAQDREGTLARLLQEGFKASVVTKPFQVGEQRFGAGTVIFPVSLNDGPKLRARLLACREQYEHPVGVLDSAHVDDGPDLGSPKVLSLRAPKVAVIIESPADPMACGAVFHTLAEAGLPFVQLRTSRLQGTDLRRYSHVVLVDDHAQGKAWQRTFGEGGSAALKGWLQDGGTLIAFQGASLFANRAGLTETGFHFLAKREEEARLKEKDPKREAAKPDATDLTQPWGEREDRDLQETIPGALLRVKIDPTHPLTWGLNATEATVLDTSDPILELSPGGENPIYFPKGDLKISGLLPKTLEPKLHQTAYLLREKRGQGTVILFSGNPVFRASTPFTTRAFLNALFFGAYRLDLPDDDRK